MPGDFTDRLTQVTEATLTIRNMAQLQENAMYMADCCPLEDLLSIILNLPNYELVVELKHFALDISECVTPYLSLGPEHPLYQTLIAQLDSSAKELHGKRIRSNCRSTHLSSSTRRSPMSSR